MSLVTFVWPMLFTFHYTICISQQLYTTNVLPDTAAIEVNYTMIWIIDDPRGGKRHLHGANGDLLLSHFAAGT